jgi:dihydroflavonol-4-reductase
LKKFLIEKQKNYNKIKKKILITGANGHLGFNLCKLFKKNYDVYGLCRSQATSKKLKEIGIKVVYGDVRKYEDFYRAAINIDFIIHCAAIYSHNQFLRNQILETSIKSVKNLCRVVNNCNISKVVYVSSVSVLGLSDNSNKKIKKIKLIKSSNDPYVLAKIQSHKIFRNFIKNNDDKKLSIILPSTILGKNDFKLTPSNKIIKKILDNPLGLYVAGGINIIDVSDVCKFIFLLLNGNLKGEFLITGYNISIKELVKKIFIIKKKFCLLFKLPKILIKVIYFLISFFRIDKIYSIPITYNQILNIGKYSYFEVDNRTILHFNIKNLDDTLKSAIKWIRIKF